MQLCRDCHDIGHPRERRRDPEDTRHCYKAMGFGVVCKRCRWTIEGRVVFDCHHYDFRESQAVAKDGRGTKRPKQSQVRRAGNKKPTQRRKSVTSKVE